MDRTGVKTSDKLNNNLFFLMLQAMRSYQTNYQPKQLATGLRTSEARIVMSLASCGPLTQSDLVSQVSKPQADTQNAFAILQEKELISREGETFTLNPRGQDMAATLWHISENEQRQQFQQFTDDEITIFRRVLLALIDNP